MKFLKLPKERKGAGAGEGLTSCWTDANRQENNRLKKEEKKKKSGGFPERRTLRSAMQSFFCLLKYGALPEQISFDTVKWKMSF